jgi:hypothetical protein
MMSCQIFFHFQEKMEATWSQICPMCWTDKDSEMLTPVLVHFHECDFHWPSQLFFEVSHYARQFDCFSNTDAVVLVCAIQDFPFSYMPSSFNHHNVGEPY